MLKSIFEERVLQPIGNFSPDDWEQVRKEYIDILCREEYGMPLPAPDKVEFEIVEENKRFAAGIAANQTIIAHTEILGTEFSFPFTAIIPKKGGKYPFFVHIDFESGVPNKYYPAEEILHNGFAAFHFNFNDVTADTNDMTDKLSGILFPDGKRENSDSGKIVMWAWAAMRIMDYAQTLDCLDLDNILRPCASRTRPWMSTVSNGALPV